MAEENEVAGPRGRTDVKSLTEMVSMATGESGSEVGEGAAAGRQGSDDVTAGTTSALTQES